MCRMPSDRFQYHEQSAARDGGVLNDMHDMPHHDRLAAVDVQSQFDAVPADGRTRVGHAVHGVPHRVAMVIAVDRLL